MLHFGLIGYPLSHSFSESYFRKKFETENINAIYKNYQIENPDSLKTIIEENNLDGINVTIPFKEKIIPYLDEIDEQAKSVGAVNCIRISNSKLTGYNTDVIGFQKCFLDFLPKEKKYKALVFGSGGSSKTVSFCLKKNNIPYLIVSRNKIEDTFQYKDIDENILKEYNLLINTTPVGMYPIIDDALPLPYQFINENHFAFDLIYNPEKTKFLFLCEQKNASIKNGLEMLHIQAEESYQIFIKSL